MGTASLPPIYRIGSIEVDTARGRLLRDGGEVRLKPKAYRILLHLIANRDRLVTKEELLELFWKDTAVTDDALTQIIAELRRALGDNPKTPVYLKTVPKMGYRFLAEVEEARPEAALIAREEITTVEIREEISTIPGPRALLGSPRRNPYRWAALGAVAVISGIAAWLLAGRAPGPPTPAAGKHQVAVAPFENASAQAELDWLCDGLPDMLTTALSRSPALSVVSREQVALWMGRASQTGLARVLELARRSQAEAVVTGSFARLGAAVRIDARIYDGRSGALLGAESAPADTADQVLKQVDGLGARLAGHFVRRTPARVSGDLATLATNNLEAYRYYTLGLRKAEALETEDAIRLFEQAVKLDPNFTMASARIGYAYAVTAARLEEGKPYLERAFQQSGRLNERDRLNIVAWYAMANQDYQEAIRTYSRMIGAYPGETEAYYRLAHLLRGESRHAESVDVLRRALAIDAEDPKLYNVLSAVTSESGRHDEAIEAARQYLRLAPQDANAHDSLGLSYQMAGRFREALAEFDRAQATKADFEIAGLHRVALLFQMGRERDALREGLRRGAEAASNQDRGRYWEELAWLYWRRGRTSDAQSALRLARRLWNGGTAWNPAQSSLPEAAAAAEAQPVRGRGGRYAARYQYFYLAQEALRRHRPAEAFDNLHVALQHAAMWGTMEPLEDALADAFLETGRLDDAIAEYRRALAVFPGMAPARYRLAEAYRRSGKVEEARAEYRRFLELWADADPELPEVVDARQRAR